MFTAQLMLLERENPAEQAETAATTKPVWIVGATTAVIVSIVGRKRVKEVVMDMEPVVGAEELQETQETVALRTVVGLATRSGGSKVPVVVAVVAAVATAAPVEMVVPGSPGKIIRIIHPPALRKVKTGLMSAVMLAVVPEEVEVLGAELMELQMELTYPGVLVVAVPVEAETDISTMPPTVNPVAQAAGWLNSIPQELWLLQEIYTPTD